MNLMTTLVYFVLAAAACMSFTKGINGNTTYTTEVYSNRPDTTTSILLTTGINSAITTESQRCDNSISCGGNFTAPFGSIVSPCYPYKDYPARKDCDYFINVPGALEIILNIIDFSLELGPSCSLIDYVEILGNGSRIGLLCSNMISEPDTLLNGTSEIAVPGEEVFIKFTSDVASTAKGFNISYAAKFIVTEPTTETVKIVSQNRTAGLTNPSTTSYDMTSEPETLLTATTETTVPGDKVSIMFTSDVASTAKGFNISENMSTESTKPFNGPPNNLLQTWEIALIAAVPSICLITGGVVTIVCVRKRKRTEVVTQESEDMVERADDHVNKKQEGTEDDDQM